MVKPFVKVELWPSVFVTVIFWDPVAALLSILMFAVIWEDELKVQELTTMPAPKVHFGEERKLLPVKVTTILDFPWGPTLGLAADMTGAG
jgi:hypothetical protein